MADGRHGAGRARRARRAAAYSVAVFAVTSVTSLTSCFARGPTSQEEARSRAEQDLAADALQRGRAREAYDHVQRALKLNPDNSAATYLGAMVLLQLCAYDETSPDCRLKEAESYARRTLEIDADHRDAKNALGVILVHEQRYDDAIAVLKPLTEDLVYASPENAWGNLGWAYLERGSTAEAIDALSRAVAVQPLFCVGRYRLGLAYEKRGDLAPRPRLVDEGGGHRRAAVQEAAGRLQRSGTRPPAARLQGRGAWRPGALPRHQRADADGPEVRGPA